MTATATDRSPQPRSLAAEHLHAASAAEHRHAASAAERLPAASAYATVRAASLALTAGLSAEDMLAQSMPDASPVKWHLAHTSWFFETFVLSELPAYRAFDPAYAILFNSYYNSVGAQHARPQRGLLTRPALAEVLRYREHIDRGMQAALAAGLSPALTTRTTLGLHHEQQHQELILTDLQHLLFQNPIQPAFRPVPKDSLSQPVPRNIPNHWHTHPGGVVEIGHDGRGFAFDNEGPQHRVHLEPFAVAARPVDNGDWLAFIADGGYRRPELWLSDGWHAVRRHAWSAPLYWSADHHHRFTLHGPRPLAPHAPVCHISFYEADAYARWAGARLPTEAEWETIARTLPSQPVMGDFAEHDHLEPAPSPASHFFGDVWVWTASPYVAYPGFRPTADALGEYNGKFMCNQMVLRGGSCATPRSHIRASYRNFFPPEARWQFSGLRLAR
ncbi:MAG: ergothioneine biosynthesis protein EgtB [Nannocystis sp.]|nr:ergothioneine biosynthesis protein EgtB [Nannocystis sp.]MBA3547284.1 ergothioneine biosynthesis protein EgtB [Nannocystis sp.]